MKVHCSNPSLVIYLVLVYALPAFLNLWFDYESDIYWVPVNNLATWIYGGILFAVTISFSFRLKSSASRNLNIPLHIDWNMPWKNLTLLLFLFLSVGIFGTISGMSQWRYSANELSSYINPISFLYVLAPNIVELILFILIFFQYNSAGNQYRIVAFMVVICLALTASGIGPMIGVLLALIFAIIPLTVRRLIFKQFLNNQGFAGVSASVILLLPIVFCLGVGAYLVGDAIKTGMSILDVISTNSRIDLESFLYYFVGRISVHWYSINAALHQTVELGVGDPVNNLMAPAANAAFRFSTLFGDWLNIERPLNGSMSRINYNLVSLYPFNDREGTSPGLIATFVLAFPIWIGPFALAGYLWIYDKVQLGLRRRFAGRLTLFGEFILLYFTAILFASPVDFLLLFDTIPFSMLALSYLGLHKKTSIKNHVPFQSNS